MIQMMGDKTWTIDQMVAEGFCREFGIFKDALINRCEYLSKSGVFKKSVVPAPNVVNSHGIRHHPQRNAYTVVKNE